MRVLRASQFVIGALHDLDLVSKNTSSISRTKKESLFVDLLYRIPDGSQFVIFEIKNQKARVRETVTELLAYEHEVLNHIPFAGANDLLIVVVSREFSTLLDHALTGLITWSRRQILCLRFDGSGSDPRLVVHVPNAWAPIGQTILPASGIVTANLCLYPNADLDENQIYAICETAAALMVREAERAGGSGFAMLAQDHFYPALTQSPYMIIAGAVNPFCFLPQAQASGLVDAALISEMIPVRQAFPLRRAELS